MPLSFVQRRAQNLCMVSTAKFGEQIRLWRNVQSLTLHDLARRAEVHYTTVNAIENGRREPAAEQVKRLAAALNMPYDYAR
jgi:transcriptional regulator with XRE-family HTH domain